MLIAVEEQFGPVVPVMRVKSVEEAITMCNANKFALQGCVFTQDINEAIRISNEMMTGTVQVSASKITLRTIQDTLIQFHSDINEYIFWGDLTEVSTSAKYEAISISNEMIAGIVQVSIFKITLRTIQDTLIQFHSDINEYFLGWPNQDMW